MKALFVETYIHHKNKIGFLLMCKARNIECVISTDASEFIKEWDLVFIPSQCILPHYFPQAKAIMYGPQDFIFVNGYWKKGNAEFPTHCVYNLLADWVIELQNEFGGLSLAPKALPFAVDIDKFKPVENPKLYDCFIYSKQRSEDDMNYILRKVQEKNLRYKVIVYGKYTENEYMETLHASKFGVWVGRHESQGFALEEALACNIPLLVFDSTSMFQEYNENNQITYRDKIGNYKLKATTIPYWDASCGLTFTERNEFANLLDRMLNTYTTFSPRDYVVKTLSPEACMDRVLRELNLKPNE